MWHVPSRRQQVLRPSQWRTVGVTARTISLAVLMLVLHAGGGTPSAVQAQPGETWQVDVEEHGEGGDSAAAQAGISADGRFVAFLSWATNLHPEVQDHSNHYRRIYIRRLNNGAHEPLELVSVDDDEQPAINHNFGPAEESGMPVSADGKLTIFRGGSTPTPSVLICDSTGRSADLCVRDREDGTTRPVTLNNSGEAANRSHDTSWYAVSADGRWVAFDSRADNLVEGAGGSYNVDTNETDDVFVRDLNKRPTPQNYVAGTTTRVSVGNNGQQAMKHRPSQHPAISADGRFVAFQSDAPNLVNGDNNERTDIFLHDRDVDENDIFDEPGRTRTMRISLDVHGNEHEEESVNPSISGDGNVIVFQSGAALLPEDTDQQVPDIYAYYRLTGELRLVSLSSDEPCGDLLDAHAESYQPAISIDGRYVAFQSPHKLVCDDRNGTMDVYVRDLADETTMRASVDSNGSEGTAGSEFPSISALGRFVAFTSSAQLDNVGNSHTGNHVFVHETDNPVPEITSPSSESTLPCDTATFHWTANGISSVTAWKLLVARDPDFKNRVWESGVLATGTLSATATGLPTDGAELWVQLSFQISQIPGNVWLSQDYTYTAADFTAVRITAPPPGAAWNLDDKSGFIRFVWDDGAVDVGAWQLWVSTPSRPVYKSPTLPGSVLKHYANIGHLRSILYVRLRAKICGTWRTVDAVEYEYSKPPAKKTSPKVPKSYFPGYKIQ